jgi:hypothetical protein
LRFGNLSFGAEGRAGGSLSYTPETGTTTYPFLAAGGYLKYGILTLSLMYPWAFGQGLFLGGSSPPSGSYWSKGWFVPRPITFQGGVSIPF